MKIVSHVALLAVLASQVFVPMASAIIPIAPPAPAAPPAPYQIDGTFTSNLIQSNQQGRSARNASITLQIGGFTNGFPALNNTSTSCFNQQGPSPAYPYGIFLDSSSINMSQCEAYNGTEIIRLSGAFIIDPFTAFTTKATPTQIASAMVAKGTLGTAFTITSGGGRDVIFTRTNSTDGNIVFTNSIFDSSDAFRVASVVSGQSALTSQLQQVEFIPANPNVGESFFMTIEGFEYEYVVQSGDTVTNVINGLVNAYNNSAISYVNCTAQSTRILCEGNLDTTSFTYSAGMGYPTGDVTAPQITLNANEPTNMTLDIGAQFVDVGATWLDNRDGSGSLIASGAVDTSHTGVYILTYSKTDSSNNTTTLTRNITVADISDPIITLNGSLNVSAELDNGGYSDEGAGWTDNVDGQGTLTGRIINDARNSYGTGTYDLVYEKEDSSENATSVTRSVTIVDTLAPRFSSKFRSGITVNAPAYFFTSSMRGTISVSATGGALTGTLTKSVVNSTISFLLPLNLNVNNDFTLTAIGADGRTTSINFNVIHSGTVNKFNALVSTQSGTKITEVSTIVGSTGAAQKVIPQTAIQFVENSESSYVDIAPETEITSTNGRTFDPTKIENIFSGSTSGLSVADRSLGVVDFGMSNTPLYFSKPIRIQFYIGTYTGSTIPVKVRHAGESTFTTRGLTNDPNATCTNGLSSSGTSIGTVSSNTVTIYSCAASTFTAVVPTGLSEPVAASTGGGGGGDYIPTVPATTMTGIVTTQSGTTIIPSSQSGTNLYTTEKVIPKKVLKSKEEYKVTLNQPSKKPIHVTIPVGFKNGTKVKIRVINAKNKSVTLVEVRVKNGTVSFRTKNSGTFEVVKK